MKKDDALKLRDRLLLALNTALVDLHLPELQEDGKLYHEEVAGENRWAMRLSRQGVWPHVPAGAGIVATPGLRYEVWFFQKRDELWFGLVCPRSRLLAPTRDALKPWWKTWVESGTYARRYKPLDPVWLRSYPDSDGVWRSAPADDKFEKNTLSPLLTLVRDTLPGIEKALAPVTSASSVSEGASGEAPTLAEAFQQAAAARNPLQELAAHFNTSGTSAPGKNLSGKNPPGQAAPPARGKK